MLSGKMMYAVHRGTYVIQLQGDIRVPLCTSLDGFFDRMLADPELSGVLIDLTDAVSVDSTTLGLLAKVSVGAKNRFECRPTIISTNPDISRVLQSMGFERVFNIVHDKPSTIENLDEVPELQVDQRKICAKVLEAHRVLMGMNEKNQVTFRNVVAALEMEQAVLGGAGSAPTVPKSASH